MWLTLIPVLIGFATKILDILTSEAVQRQVKEAKNARSENAARKALAKDDARLFGAICADQHNRVLAALRGSPRGGPDNSIEGNTGQPSVGQ